MQVAQTAVGMDRPLELGLQSPCRTDTTYHSYDGWSSRAIENSCRKVGDLVIAVRGAAGRFEIVFPMPTEFSG